MMSMIIGALGVFGLVIGIFGIEMDERESTFLGGDDE